MLILQLKLKKYIDVNDGEFYLQILNAEKGEVSIKMLEQKENGFYVEKNIIKIKKGTSKKILDGLSIAYIKGEQSRFKFGFFGDFKVSRKDKVNYKLEKKNQFSFDFDTEGY